MIDSITEALRLRQGFILGWNTAGAQSQCLIVLAGVHWAVGCELLDVHSPFLFGQSTGLHVGHMPPSSSALGRTVEAVSLGALVSLHVMWSGELMSGSLRFPICTMGIGVSSVH